VDLTKQATTPFDQGFQNKYLKLWPIILSHNALTRDQSCKAVVTRLIATCDAGYLSNDDLEVISERLKD
jgi:hypothetical protein